MSAFEKSRDQSLLERASPGYRAARLAELKSAGRKPVDGAALEPMTTMVGAVDAGRCTLRGGARAVWITFTCHEGVTFRTVLTEELARELLRRMECALSRPMDRAAVDRALGGLALPAADPELEVRL